MRNKLPKAGDIVICPADRGEAEYTGKILSAGTDINKNIHGIKFVWCEVDNISSPAGHKSVWPSNRLGYRIA